MATSAPAPILPDPARLHLTHLQATPGLITAIVTTTSSEAVCPLCQSRSNHVHSRYVRLIADLPRTSVGSAFRIAYPSLLLLESGVLTPDLHGEVT